jgi:hypothetical protein
MSKLWSLKSWAEGIADATLFIFVTVPLLAILVTVPFCSGWNEGTGRGTCTLPILDGLYNRTMGFALLLAFGGVMIVLPIIVIAGLVSVVAKIRRFVRGYRPQTPLAIVSELAFIIPIVAIVYLFSSFGYRLSGLQ